jgi:hypothetical protein
MSEFMTSAGGRAAMALLTTVIIAAGLILIAGDQAYLWIKAIHVIAVIAWMAGLLYLPRLFVYHTQVAVGRKRQHHAQAGHDVRDPQELAAQDVEIYRRRRSGSAAGRLRFPAVARGELPAGSGRYLCFSVPDPPIRCAPATPSRA